MTVAIGRSILRSERIKADMRISSIFHCIDRNCTLLFYCQLGSPHTHIFTNICSMLVPSSYMCARSIFGIKLVNSIENVEVRNKSVGVEIKRACSAGCDKWKDCLKI